MKQHFFQQTTFFCRIIIIGLVTSSLLYSCKKDFTNQEGTNNLVASTARELRKPNIILFVADDLGYEVPHFTGGQTYSTPNLDFMAANGTHFDQTFSHPDGFPSRLALFTGKYNFRNYTYWGKLVEGQKTIGNLLEDADYATCFAGKWQMDGGDSRIHSAGFQKYMAFNAFNSDNQRDGRYKDPTIYVNGNYLTAEQTKGKYSEDMFSDYVCNFIDSNKFNSFFALYSFNLVAAPYVPSPDHPDYATWDPHGEVYRDDPKYFPSMVSYLDKMIGKVMNKVRVDGLENNTIFMFIADNATQKEITSLFKGRSITGTKTQTNTTGVLTPFVAYWKGTVAPNATRNTLIDFTDFLPTFADIAKVSVPVNWGILDGTSFYDNMISTAGVNRDWVFCDWDNDRTDNGEVPRERYVNDHNYKLYDTLNYSRFYNVQKDIYEKHPIPNNKLTTHETKIKENFIKVLQNMHN